MRIHAITSYYNPKGFASRYRNFIEFRRHLDVPLLTIEWAHDGRFELGPGDSDRLIRVRGGDLMWQKERLLNLALHALPPSCEAVVWLDCDVLFEDARWVSGLDAALEEAPVVQLFSEVVHLDPHDGSPLLVRESLARARDRRGAASLGERVRSLDVPKGPNGDENDELLRLASRPSSGHAWAARRSLLDRHGFYDGCVYGAGDMALALAALGVPESFISSFPMNAAQKAHYLAWAAPFASATGGRVGWLPTRIEHLYHGPLASRQYRTRLHIAADSGFDPARDLALDADGVWRWKTASATRAAWMNGFFERRAEDGEARHTFSGA